MVDPDPNWIERVLGHRLAEVTPAAWGFQNRTDIVELAGGERVVLQRYRRREDAEYRLRMIEGLQEPAAAVGIAISRVRSFDLDAEPPWMSFHPLPGIPVPDVRGGLEGPAFPGLARAMGEMLAAFRELPTAGLDVDRSWADPANLAARAGAWAAAPTDLSEQEHARLAGDLARVPELFQDRPVVLAHGDFSPVNLLTDGTSLTGLVDFESTRLADPLFDVAWWEWSVGHAGPSVRAAVSPEFLKGARVDAGDPEFPARVRALQLLRMLELLAGDSLSSGVRRSVANHLRTTLQEQAT